MLDLKNCPFCGGDKVSAQHGTTSTRGQYLMVWCVSCQAAGGEHLAEAEAIAAWNRRALQAVGPERAVAVKWEQLSELINAAVKVAIRTGSDFHIDADKLREFACSALVATPPAETVVEALILMVDAFLSRNGGCFPMDEVTEEQKLWKEAMKAAYAVVGQPRTRDRDEKLRALAAKPAVKDDETVVEALGGIASLLGNVEYKGGGANAAAMYADILNDIRRFIRAALAAKDGRS